MHRYTREFKKYLRRMGKEAAPSAQAIEPIDLDEMRAIATELKSVDWRSSQHSLNNEEEDFDYLFDYDDERLSQLIRAA